jgi:hypothetical protein
MLGVGVQLLLSAEKVKFAMHAEQTLLLEQAEQFGLLHAMQLPPKTEKPFMQVKQTPVELQVRQSPTPHETQAPS